MNPTHYSHAGFAGHILGFDAGICGIFVLVRYGIVLRLKVTEGVSRRRGRVDVGLERIVTIDTAELERCDGLRAGRCEEDGGKRGEGKEEGRVMMDEVRR